MLKILKGREQIVGATLNECPSVPRKDCIHWGKKIVKLGEKKR